MLQWISLPIRPTPRSIRRRSVAGQPSSPTALIPWAPTRWWTRADGKQCAVEGGDFGWSIDSSSLAKQVEDAINNKQTGEIEIKYSPEGRHLTAAKGEPDWKAYIDVDLSEQHARYYDGAEISFGEANFISGKPSETPPPRACGRSTATTVAAPNRSQGPPRPVSPNTRAR